MSVAWGKDADRDHMAEKDVVPVTIYDLVVWVVLAGLGWGIIAGIVYMVWHR